MSTRYVVDSSVACKWLFVENESPRARQLMDDYRAQSVELLAPDVLMSEVANVIWKRVVLRRTVDPRRARAIYNDFLFVTPKVIAAEDLAGRAIAIAIDFGHPVYDCFYIAAAEHLGCDLITADERMAAKFSTDFPFIRRLSTI